MAIEKEEQKEWEAEVGRAANTYPHFANGPFVKSIYRAVKELNTVGELIEHLTKAVETSSDSADKLGRRLFWLNFILAIATVVGAIATVALVFKK